MDPVQKPGNAIGPDGAALCERAGAGPMAGNAGCRRKGELSVFAVASAARTGPQADESGRRIGDLYPQGRHGSLYPLFEPYPIVFAFVQSGRHAHHSDASGYDDAFQIDRRRKIGSGHQPGIDPRFGGVGAH